MRFNWITHHVIDAVTRVTIRRRTALTEISAVSQEFQVEKDGHGVVRVNLIAENI